ncbi:NAD(P)/FAD-dependent oxidoreductase [Wenzhouxiangella limi]|uniref:NADH:ubiquinone reductase (non-electrogenic) n=1 Tax=Wenzhouxiangella limi TaxID=2707351 RepID=A0A845V655_9GAMM|nr:NAD(P)/FAD-dependent oxidoreductase [Wenzhouxiangella limi]NDY96656.1 NAD(P)/FAD-dependent oxidoreductase [Wenzhouxiangella limi]
MKNAAQSVQVSTEKHRPRVVILGAGFAGLTVAMRLACQPVEIVIIDRHNYHLFQPLLYQVATAALSPADIAAPIRGILGHFDNIQVLLDTVTNIDRDRCQIQTLSDRRIDYDYLVIATGATHNYFGRDEWHELAPGLKRIEDATELRRRILLAFERAEIEENPARRQALMTFVIVGGGPTGVEMAGAMAELTRFTLARNFRRIQPENARIILADANERLLRPFPEALSEKARRSLERMGVEMKLGTRVDHLDRHGVRMEQDKIATETVIWSAGVKASPAADWLGVDSNAAGQVAVEADLQLPGDDRIYLVGDVCQHINPDQQPTPGLAPAAKQQGKHVARDLIARIRGRRRPGAFVYKGRGQLATIGRHSAICNFGQVRVTGYAGWWLWGAAHIYFLIGFRNRVVVAANWFWSYLTFGRGIRLITGDVAVKPDASSAGNPGRSTLDQSR